MAQTDVIFTPDQRVRVFISSTLGELAEERVAARRAIRRLHLVPAWWFENRWTALPASADKRLGPSAGPPVA